MEKKTKLITIEYDEYIELMKIKNNFQREVYIKLIDELNKFTQPFADNMKYYKNDIHNLFRNIISVIENKIILLEKEGKNNE